MEVSDAFACRCCFSLSLFDMLDTRTSEIPSVCVNFVAGNRSMGGDPRTKPFAEWFFRRGQGKAVVEEYE